MFVPFILTTIRRNTEQGFNYGTITISFHLRWLQRRNQETHSGEKSVWLEKEKKGACLKTCLKLNVGHNRVDICGKWPRFILLPCPGLWAQWLRHHIPFDSTLLNIMPGGAIVSSRLTLRGIKVCFGWNVWVDAVYCYYSHEGVSL